MNNFDTIISMYDYGSKMFPEPDLTWPDRKIEDRIYEIFGYETLICRCFDSFRDPIEVGEGLLLEIENRYYDELPTSIAKRRAQKMIFAINKVLDYIK